jgi:Bacterial Ig-like domain (group 3)/MBG domain (YGX type)/NHL repeat
MGPQSTTTHRRTPTPLWIALVLLLLSLRMHGQSIVSATAIPLILPSAIVFDPQGNLYLAETANHVVRKVDTTGTITIIAGTGTQGFSGDSGPAIAAQLDFPQGLAIDANQNLYIADTHNHRIRKLNLTTGVITTIAGSPTPGFDGDNGLATAAHLNLPTALTLDSAGNLYLADTQNHRIREIATTGIIITIAGNGTQGFSGDNGPATAASIDSPNGLATDSTNLYLADTHNHRIRKLNLATGIITTLAGTGIPNYNGDGTAANLALPHGLTLDASGNLYLADTANNRIRRIDASTGQITTIAGQGTQTFAGDGSFAATASLDTPRATATSPTGLITLADTGNQRIRQLSSDATIHTIVGLGATTPGALTLSAPSVVTYGTGKLTATLSTTTQASGAITFLDIFTPLAAANDATLSPITLGTAPITTNSATFSTTTLPAGHHSITASYSGDLTHTSAQSSTFSLTISPRTITAAITPSALLYGQPIPTLSATLNNLLQQDASAVAATFTITAAALAPVGTYPITTTLSGPAAGNYTLVASPANLTIALAPTLTTLAASATTIDPGLPVSLTTQVESTTAGLPTGTVTLLDGPTTLFTAQVPPTGSATFTTAALTQGIHTLTTRYSGDTNFTSSTSTPQLIGIGINPNPDFTLATTGATTQTIPSGSTANFTFSVQFQGAPLSSPITLSASGLPNLATASFNPAYIPPGAATNTFTVTITTPKTTANQQKTTFTPIKFALIFLPITILTIRRRKAISLLALTFLATITGCGDRIYTGTQSTNPTQTYTIAITGTATTPTGATLTHTTTVALQLQQPPTS